MKTFIGLFKKDTWFYLFFSAVFLFICFLPILYRVNVTPSNRSYAGSIFYTDDYAIYTSTIEQGLRGRWNVIDKYTTESHPASFIHFHYLLMGKIGGLFGLSSIEIYHIGRLISAGILLLVIIIFLKQVVPNKLQKLSYLFILFSSGWPNLNPATRELWRKLVPQFIEPDPAIRLVHQPHFIFGTIFTLITILLFVNPPAHKIKLKLILFSLFSAYAALTDPAQTVTTIMIAICLSFVIYISSKNVNKLKYHLGLFICMFTSVMPVFLYLKWIRTFEPWKTIAFFDTFQEFPQKFSELFFAYGPLSLITLVGIILFITQKKQINKNLIAINFSWIISSILLIFILSEQMGINRNRLFHSPLYIPLSIISVYAISIFSEYINKIKKEIPKWVIRYSITSMFFIVCLPVFIAGILWQINEHNVESALIYPPKTHIEAYSYLKKNTNPSDAILCLYEACNQIPFYSGNTVFIGNISETINEKYKSELAKKIFTGEIIDNKLKDTLTDNNIKYLFIGYQEGFSHINFLNYSFLTKVFQNPGVTLYKVSY